MDTTDYSEMLPVVNEQGEVTGKTTRKEAHGKLRPLHPVVHLHVFNSRGELYLQKRPQWKDVQPGKWDTATGGHVGYGESIENALMREVAEELGITGFAPCSSVATPLRAMWNANWCMFSAHCTTAP